MIKQCIMNIRELIRLLTINYININYETASYAEKELNKQIAFPDCLCESVILEHDIENNELITSTQNIIYKARALLAHGKIKEVEFKFNNKLVGYSKKGDHIRNANGESICTPDCFDDFFENCLDDIITGYEYWKNKDE